MKALGLFLVWGIFFSSCSTPEKKANPHHLQSVRILGRFSGYESYDRWVVFLSWNTYRSQEFSVNDDGSFMIKLLDLPKHEYQVKFGEKNREGKYGSFKLKVDQPRINLKTIQKD